MTLHLDYGILQNRVANDYPLQTTRDPGTHIDGDANKFCPTGKEVPHVAEKCKIDQGASFTAFETACTRLKQTQIVVSPKTQLLAEKIKDVFVSLSAKQNTVDQQMRAAGANGSPQTYLNLIASVLQWQREVEIVTHTVGIFTSTVHQLMQMQG